MKTLEIWALVSGLILLLLQYKTWRFTKNIHSLKDVQIDQGQGTAKWPRISFIVPACNEAETIRAAATSLLAIDYPNLEIVIVNDRSTDATGSIAESLALQDPRLKVLHIDHLPAGWLGKVHALNTGIEATRAEWILLADADIHFRADAIKKAISYCAQNEIDFLTAVPDVKSKSAILQTLIAQLFHQASLFFNPRKLNDPRQKTCYGQGAFMLLRRSVYERSEGMRWLRMEAIDDTGLAVMMRRAGARMGAVAGQGEIELEWYPGVSAYIRGVEKNAFAFCQYNWGLLVGFSVLNWALVFGFSIAPFLSGNRAIEIFCGGAWLAYSFAIRRQMKRLLDLKFWQILVFPLAVVALPLVFIRAAFLVTINEGIDWRGTFYSLRDLRLNQRMKLANLVFAVDEAPTEEPASVLAQTADATSLD